MPPKAEGGPQVAPGSRRNVEIAATAIDEISVRREAFRFPATGGLAYLRRRLGGVRQGV